MPTLSMTLWAVWLAQAGTAVPGSGLFATTDLAPTTAAGVTGAADVYRDEAGLVMIVSLAPLAASPYVFRGVSSCELLPGDLAACATGGPGFLGVMAGARGDHGQAHWRIRPGDETLLGAAVAAYHRRDRPGGPECEAVACGFVTQVPGPGELP